MGESAEEQRHPALKLQERQAESMRNQNRAAGQSRQQRKPGKSSHSLGTVIQRKSVLHE